MEQDAKFYIPKYIDEPIRIIFFSIDELAIILTIGLVSYAVGHELIGVVTAACAYFGYNYIKGKETSAFLQRWIYWHLGFSARHYIPKAKTRKYKG